jgi:hypothetical protein
LVKWLAHQILDKVIVMLVGFFLRILQSSQDANYTEIILANSGYMLDMKVEKNQDLSIFFATYWNLL